MDKYQSLSEYNSYELSPSVSFRAGTKPDHRNLSQSSFISYEPDIAEENETTEKEAGLVDIKQALNSWEQQYDSSLPKDTLHVHFQSQSEEAPLINSSTSSEDGRQTPSLPEPGSSIELKKVRGSKLPSKDYDSLDYDISYNVPYKNLLRSYTAKTYIHMQVMKWVLVGIIGVLTGIVAFFIDICVKELFKLKYSLFDKVYDATIEDGQVVLGFLVLLAFNVAFGIIASTLIVIEPVAAGSGIPEIKCYLNGVKIPHVTRVSTLLAKAVGVLFSVAGGFFVGKEGPMIHSGAIIGAGVPQFRSMLFKCIKFPYPYFRSDRDKRDFVSSGAAAGVAAAFGAPIGGVLFSLEEGSSFWNQALTWRTLFCSFCATFVLNMFLSLREGGTFGFLALGSPGLVNFGVFGKENKELWNAYHLIIFMLMGAVGGLMGALFNNLNINLTKYRMRYLSRRNRAWNVAEVVLIAMVTTVVVFCAATLLGSCRHESHLSQKQMYCPEIVGDVTFRNETRDYFCPGHGKFTMENKHYYNDMATLMFNSQEVAIKQLFHQDGAFTLPTLFIIFITFYFIACWTYGAGIPSGLFIPCLVVGAAYGRFVATVFNFLYSWQPKVFYFLTNLYPGTYALIGAAAFLGGVVRMTISLTVILIESTNEIEYGLPIMLTLMIAKWVGDIFNEGLYDMHIELKRTPLLGWESPRRMNKLAAEDVMNSKHLHYVYPITRVRSVERLLRTTAHSAFLVVTPVRADEVFVRPMNVMTTHVPQLYTRHSIMGETDASDTEFECHGRNVTPEVFESHEHTLTRSYSLPGHLRDKAVAHTEVRKKEKHLAFHGIILRSQLVVLLKNKIFFSQSDGADSQPEIDHDALTAEYPRYPNVFSVRLSEEEKEKLMDLSIFMNPCPYTISREAPLPQVFNLFRTMGLRHLPVMQENGIVAGIITRHDLTHERLHEVRHLKKGRSRQSKRNRKLLINNSYQDIGSSTVS